MKTVSPFDRLAPPGRTIAFRFDGAEVAAAPGETVAAALLAAGVTAFRITPVAAAPRGPWCMMGACYDCLVAVDGVSVQACMTPVRAGMVVRRLEPDRRGDG